MASEKKLQQRIHRESLKLARLKNKANKERTLDTRMKLKLGGFLFLLGWQDQSMETLSDRLAHVADQLKKANPNENEQYKTRGQSALRLIIDNKTKELSSAKLDADQRRAVNHRKITIGGLMVSLDLHNAHRATLFGVLLEHDQSLKSLDSSTRKQ